MSELTKPQKIEMLKVIHKSAQRYLPDEKFAEVFEEGQKVLDDRGDDEITMFFMLHGRNYDLESKQQWCIMPVMFADWPPPEEIDGHKFGKRGCLMAVGVAFAEKFPEYMLVEIVHVSEAWMVNRPKDAPQEDMDLAPSKAPDRIEVGLVHALSFDRRSSYRSGKLLRDEKGEFKGWETNLEVLHNPDNPVLPPDQQQDYLTNYIFEGYMKLKRKEGDDATKG